MDFNKFIKGTSIAFESFANESARRRTKSDVHSSLQKQQATASFVSRCALVTHWEPERGIRGCASTTSKTECPRQTGPIARVSGRDTVPPAKRRWVPSTLLHQNVLSTEDQNDLVFRKVRGILNKLTPENFKKLSDDLLGTELNSIVILKGVIWLIFEKALDEPKYSSMYAQLCKRLSREAPNFETENAPCTFLLLLLNMCKAEFENRSAAAASEACGPPDVACTPEEEERRQLAKRKMLGNIKFIGELAKLEILSEGILHRCIHELLRDKRRRGDTPQDTSEDLECLCQILRTCGRILDTDKGRKLMDQYFDRMKQLAENMELPPRIRFMLKDVIELRADRWAPRKATIIEGPIPINQIRPADDDSRSNSYLMRERRNHQDRDSGRHGGSDDIFRHSRMKIRTGLEDIMSGISIGSSSTNLIPTHNDKFNFNPNGYGVRDGGYRGHNNQRSGGGGGYNMYNNQRGGAFKHNQNNQHSNSTQFNNASNKEVAPRFKKSLVALRGENLGELELRPSADFKIFNQGSMKSVTSNMVMNNRSSSDLNIGSGGVKPILAPTASLHKEPLIIKQAPAEKPKQAKKDKGPNKEEILKKMNVLIDDYLQNSMAMTAIMEIYRDLKVPDKFIKDVLLNILKMTLTKTDAECVKIMKFLNTLRGDGLVTGSVLQDALKSFCGMLDETDSDVQKNKASVANMLACAIQERLVTLGDIASLTENGAHYPLFLVVLQQLHKTMEDKQQLTSMFNASKVNMMAQLPESDRTKERLAEILDDRNLTFLYPLLRIQAELAKQLQADPQPTQFYKWIKDNLDPSNYTDTGFINALMTVLFKYIMQETGTEGGGADPNDKTALERERSMLEKYTAVLQQFLHNRTDLQVTAIYSLQAHWFALGHPKGLLLRWFNALYDLEVIEEDAFLQWKDDPPDAYPGKGQALFQVNQWLTWLEEAESDNDEADD